MARHKARWLAPLAVIAAVLTVSGPARGSVQRIDSARSPGDTRVFAPVPSPGHPEGIAIRDGVVYVGTHTSAYGNAGHERSSRIFRYDQRSGHLIGEVRIEGQDFGTVHGLTGMSFGPDGRLYVLDRSPPRLLALDFRMSPPVQTTYATFPDLPRCSAAPPPCAPSSNPGDSLVDALVFDSAGGAYVTDVQKATIFRVPPGGGTGQVWFQDPRLDGSFGVNGIAIEPSGQRIVIAVTMSNQPDTANLGSIYSLPMVERPGSGDLVLVHRYAEPFAAPDGISFGRDGRLYVALAGANQISVLDLGGRETARFPSPADNARQEIPFDTPASLVFDGHGSLLVTNQSYVNSVPRHWAVLDTWVGDPE
jgi:sugar lactone lactonase YvrE